MIEGKYFGIHISGIRDGHSPSIYSSLKNPKEFELLFKDIRTAVNKIDQPHFFKVHQTSQYSVASLVTTGFRDRGGRPGAYITISLFVRKGMMFSTSPRKKLIELLSFYKEKQGNNFDSNQFTSNGLLEVVGDLQVVDNRNRATPQKVAGFALYQHESHIDKFLQFNGGALAYGHYYFLPLEAKEKMASFKTEISNLFGLEGTNSRLNDLYKAAPVSKTTIQSPKPDPNKRPEQSKEIKRPQGNIHNGSSNENSSTKNRIVTGHSVGSQSSGTRVSKSKHHGDSNKWKKILIPVVGIAFVGFTVWLIMTFMGGDDTTSTSPAPPAKPKSAATDTVKEESKEEPKEAPKVEPKEEPKEDTFNQRVNKLKKGKFICPNYGCLDLGNGKKNDVIDNKIKYTKGQWYWDNEGRDPKVETPINVPDCLESELKREKKAIDKRETPEPTDPQELTPLEKLKKQLNKIEGEPTESRKEDAWKEFLNSADWKNATNVTKRKIEDFEEYIKLKELYDINN